MKGQLDRLGVGYERIPGVVGLELESEEIKRAFSPVRSLIAMRRKMSLGQIGCALSHLSICRKMIDEGTSAALVLEDDCIISQSFPRQLAEVEKFLDPARPQVFLFNGFGADIDENTSHGIRRSKSGWCADCYVCTLSAAKLLVAKNYPVAVVCDNWKRFRRWFGLELYHVVPAAVKQADAQFDSNIPVRKKIGSWIVRQAFWVVDFLLIKTTGR